LNPQYEISVTWTDLKRYCSTNSPALIPTASSQDFSIFPTLATDESDALYHVVTTVEIELGREDQFALTLYQQAIEGCRPWSMQYVARVDSEVKPGMMGLNRDQFVSRTGTLPTKLSHGPAVAAGIFFSGVIHTYWVAQYPFVRAYIVKKNATLAQYVANCQYVSTTCRG
jgi:hypothetical protein